MNSARSRLARFGVTALAIACAYAGIALPITAGASAPEPGYRLLAGDGGVFAFGGAQFLGSAASDPGKCPTSPPGRNLPEGSCAALASTADGGGYWILNRALGTVYPFGDAGSFGQPADQFAGVSPESVPAFVGIVSTPNAQGYWVLAVPPSGAGRVMPFGNAEFFGDTQTIASHTHIGFNGMPVGLATTRDGKGYWEAHSDGGVFAFGDAHFFGSMGGTRLNKPIVGIAATADGNGYWLVASDGGVFAFGDARFGGSVAGKPLAGPVVGVARNPVGPGYWLTSSDGGVYALGGAPFLGSMGATPLNKPVVAIASNGRA